MFRSFLSWAILIAVFAPAASAQTDLQRGSGDSVYPGETIGQYDSLYMTPDSGIILRQNYPNPFRNSTTIVFQIVDPALYGRQVDVAVFDMLGNRLQTLYENSADDAIHTLEFQGAGLPPGRYSFRLRCRGRQVTRLMNMLPRQ